MTPAVEINIIKAAERFIFVLNSNVIGCFKCLIKLYLIQISNGVLQKKISYLPKNKQVQCAEDFMN